MAVYFYDYEIGKIGIAESDGKITNVYFECDEVPKDMEICETPVLREAAEQLRLYLKGELKEFSLPLNPHGTEFMKQVWNRLCEIPYGKTSTYREIAVKAGSPRGCRAVGLANNRNPIPIFIPCHRVVGTNGSLTGYRGGLELKRRLLEMENGK